MPNKGMTYRKDSQLAKLRAAVRYAIEAEAPLKALAGETGITNGYAYQLALRMGYRKMVVSPDERALIRAARGTTKLFKGTQ